MSANKCARCEQTVYPVEGLRCLDKLWHKGCFKCQECNMTLSLKNYKGFGKKPYCNAHCPQAKATTVADTPESRRLAENTRIQSQAKYHEDFEKSKGKGFTAIADDPETLRLKNTSKIISNVAYHGELERKKQMEERRSSRAPEDTMHQHHNLAMHNNNNNNNNVHPTKQHANRTSQDVDLVSHLQVNNNYSAQAAQQQQQHLQRQQQQQQALQKQQLLKQQQMQYAQETQMNRHSQQFVDVPHPQTTNKLLPMSNAHLSQQQHQHLSARQQQQQQQLMMQQQQQQLHHQQQQHRHSMEAALPINRQQAMLNNNPQTQQMIKNQMIPVQQQQQHHQQAPQVKYLPMKDSVVINQSPNHIMYQSGGQVASQQHMMSPSHISSGAGMPNAHRISVPNPAMMAAAGQQQLLRGYNPQQQLAMAQQQQQQMNGIIPKQQFINQPQTRQMINPNQIPAMNIINVSQQHIRNPQQMHPQHQQAQQIPRRVFRAVYDYVANDVDEVSFFENDILVDCVNVDGNWLVGKVARSGQTGMLPANYVVECG